MTGAGGGRVRVAVIGCGAIAEEHLTYLGSAPGVDLVAVCDLSPALAELARQRHGARDAFTDADQMLAQSAPDAVHVLTPPHLHARLTLQAISAGAHVICEKPLAPTLAGTAEVIDAARLAGLAVVETRNLLYNDVVRAFDASIAAGRVGTPREIDVALALPLGSADVPSAGIGMPGGLVHDYLPHLAYLLLHFASPIDDVGHVAGAIRNLSARPEIGYDHVDVLISLGEIRARLRISPDVLPESLRITVRGTNGSLEADLYQPYLLHEGPPWVGKRASFGLVAEGIRLAAAGGRNLRDRLVQHGTYHGMARMLDEIYGALRAGRPVPISERDLLASANLIDRIIELTGSGS